MPLMSGRNEYQYKLAEAESENDKNDGRAKLINFWEITWEKVKSFVQWAWRVNSVPTIKHQFGWLQQVSVRKLRI